MTELKEKAKHLNWAARSILKNNRNRGAATSSRCKAARARVSTLRRALKNEVTQEIVNSVSDALSEYEKAIRNT